jgi:Poly(R)-hydroxyalkanoic acid synthase subunit (PHA_synth_III_E)
MATANNEQEKQHTNGKNDPSTEDYYKAWSGFYQQMADESTEFFQKGMTTFQRMVPLYPGNEIFKQWLENSQDFMNRMTEESLNAPGDVNTYKRMYDLWLETWTRNLEGYMKTPEFAAQSGKDLETFSDLQKKMGEMMEGYWQAIHLPSSQDMREIYHKLYMIERKLDELARHMRKSQAASSSGPDKK